MQTFQMAYHQMLLQKQLAPISIWWGNDWNLFCPFANRRQCLWWLVVTNPLSWVPEMYPSLLKDKAKHPTTKWRGFLLPFILPSKAHARTKRIIRKERVWTKTKTQNCWNYDLILDNQDFLCSYSDLLH